MPFEATSQDSRDPNSPQWGYVKVRDPENQLCYPAKDEIWNEYVMFVHDTSMPIDGIDYETNKETGTRKIKRRSEFNCVMVPAKLEIDCNQLDKQIQAYEAECKRLKSCAENSEDEARYQKYLEDLQEYREHINPLSKDRKIIIPSETKEDGIDQTTLWVALVIGPKNSMEPSAPAKSQ